ncbi:uncharacterized protein [Ptychodera flava]|uniref:uncharacterized protein n=1 Tax=Ptychodera flava TaxID=63121 RepID=UPI00396A8CFF
MWVVGQQRRVTLRCYTTKDDGLKSVKISHTKGDIDAQGEKEIDMEKSGRSFLLTIDPFTEQNAGKYYVEAVDGEDYVITLRFDLKFYNEIEELLEECPLTLKKVLEDYQEMLEAFESHLKKENFEDLFHHLTGKPSGEWRESSVSESAKTAIQSIASQNGQLNLSHVLQCLHVQMQRNKAVLGIEKYHKDCIACGFFYNLAHQVDHEEQFL